MKCWSICHRLLPGTQVSQYLKAAAVFRIRTHKYGSVQVLNTNKVPSCCVSFKGKVNQQNLITRSIHLSSCDCSVHLKKDKSDDVSAAVACFTSTSSNGLKQEEHSQDALEEERRPSLHLAEYVMTEACKKDKMIAAVGIKRIHDLIQETVSHGFTEDEVQSLFMEKPAFLKQHDKMVQLIGFLQGYGFEKKHILMMFSNSESAGLGTPKRFEDIIECLRSAGFHDKSMFQLVAEHPEIVRLPTKVIESRVKYLKTYFKSSDVIHVVMKSPQVLSDDVKEIEEKFQYVFHRMGVTQRQMLYTHMFSYPLEYIKNRHIFLKRAGFFVNVGRLREGEKSPNPRLDEIIECSDGDFARKFGNMTAMEYSTFCQLLDKESANDLEEED